LPELDIESLDHDAQGVGHSVEGKVVFVEGALPGERVSANTPQMTATATTLAVSRPSRKRMDPDNAKKSSAITGTIRLVCDNDDHITLRHVRCKVPRVSSAPACRAIKARARALMRERALTSSTFKMAKPCGPARMPATRKPVSLGKRAALASLPNTAPAMTRKPNENTGPPWTATPSKLRSVRSMTTAPTSRARAVNPWASWAAEGR
jgi:predicted RNA-binding protein with TRAM domain